MNGTSSARASSPWWRRALDWPFALAEREPVAMALGLGMAAACWFYRGVLAWEIFSGRAQPFSLRPEQVPVTAFLSTLGGDWLVVLTLTLIYLGFKFWFRLRLPQLMATEEVQTAEVMFAGALLLLFTMMVLVHGVLLLELESGLTWTFVQMAHELVGTNDFFKMFPKWDAVFLAVPLAVFAAGLLDRQQLRKVFRPTILAMTLIVLVLQLLPAHRRLTPELADSPVPYFLKDLVSETFGYFWRNGNGYRNSNLLPGEEQLQSIALVDPAFVTRPPSPSPAPPAIALTPAGKPWNVLLFVMESTGADYVFDAPFGQQTPMPFLHRLTDEGMYCSNHYSSCNSSPGAAFSILTGLYPPPERLPFSLRKDAAIPIWNSYLGSSYDTFLVHPSSATYSFPTDLLRNDGFTNFYFQDQIPLGPLPDVTDMARNEIDCVQFFEQKMDAAREPFLGVYWSFVPHYPYSDYGPEYKVRPSLKLRRDRYYDDLRLLDTQLARVFQHLEETGLADRTIVIVLGDHGEAFGQHQGFWAHSYGGYAEMYRAPLVFWQPKLIPPRVVSKVTTHVDILPTLLDLLGMPWDPTHLQGESLLRDSTRKYIFAEDLQADYVTSVDTNLTKVCINMAGDEAQAYNLAKDPHERAPLNENQYSDQIRALLKYCNYQKQMVDNYNSGILAAKRYPPQTP